MRRAALRLSGESRWLSGLALIVLIASLGAFIVGEMVGVPVWDVYWGYASTVALVAPVALLLMAIPVTLRAMLRGVRDPLSRLKDYSVERLGSVDHAIGTLGPILMMPLLMGAFGTFKQMMPLVVPFLWDDAFAEFGRLLAFGYRPWQLTHALFGSALATEIINGIYFAWVPMLFCSVFGFAILARPYLRARFFVSFFFAWLLLGILAAYLLASAGPCYANLIGAAADFKPLMSRLHQIDAHGKMLETMHWQGELWKAYSEHRFGPGLGISAMPSMHNAIAFLYLLAAARGSLFVRLLSRIFAAAILVGSVHLGWHYLADGLGGWAGMAGVWWLAGRYLDWCGYAGRDDREPVSGVDGLGEPLPA